MNKSHLICLIISLTGGLHAQTTGAETKKDPSKLIDAAKRLLDDKSNISDDTKKKAADAAKAVMQEVPDDIKNKAKEILKDPKGAAARSQAIDTVKTAVQKQVPAAMPPTAVPKAAETAAVAKSAAIEAPPSGPQAQRLMPLVLDDPQAVQTAKAGETVITATKSGYFNSESSTGIFTGNVKARSPQMSIDCEELEIHMLKTTPGTASKKANAVTDSDIVVPDADKKKKGGLPAGNRIDVAYARGTMVTIEKRTEDGEIQVAHCNQEAIFDGKTDEITLRGWPQVQRGNKFMEATDPRCIIIIDQKGRLTAKGGLFRTTLVDDKPKEMAPAASSTPPPAPLR